MPLPAILIPKTAKLAAVAINAVLGIVGIIALSLLLGGCTSKSPGIPGIYLLQISNNTNLPANKTTPASDWVRIGYLGVCAHIESTTTCTTKSQNYIFNGPTDEEAYALNTATRAGVQLLTHRVFTPHFLILATAAFVLAVLLTLWHLLRIKQTGKLAGMIAGLYVLSAIVQFLALVAFWWASHALKYASSGSMAMTRGGVVFYTHVVMIFWPLGMMVMSCGGLMWEKAKGLGRKRASPGVVV